MALVIKDRVRQTSTTAGTGTITLSGSVTGYQNFSVIGNGNTTYYTIADQSGSNWEVGIGTYSTTGPTLARTTVLSSSNAGSLVNFTAGTKDVFVTQPSSKAVYQDSIGNVGIGGFTTYPLSVSTLSDSYGLAHADNVNGRYFATYLDSSGVWVGADSSDPLILMQNAGEAMRIDTAQNVGIGTPTPTAKLDVNGDIKGTTITSTGDGTNSGSVVIKDPSNSKAITLTVLTSLAVDYLLTLPSSAGSANQVLKTDGTGVTSWVTQGVQGTAPVTVTAATYTVAATDQWIIGNRAGTITLTLPTASASTGRSLNIKTIQAQTVVSASSNVVPLNGGAAGTAILAATIGKYATLVSDGTNWIIMGAN